ncbi:MAG: nitrilase-related carbon-nitrogen hydrolase [Acidobacteriota bacterium]
MRLALAQIVSSPDRDTNVARALRAIDEAAAAGADCVVFAEVVLDRFFPVRPGAAACDAPEGSCGPAARAFSEPIPGPTVELLQAKAREHEMVIVFNLYERVGEGDDTLYYDSSPVIDADGSLLGVTRMLHITDYALFHETDYYDPGDTGAPVFDTRVGKIGVAICYDRHYPEYMRALAIAGADLVVVPQAGALGEWPEGLYEAELRVAAFQNGYFAALANRVGDEGELVFGGESFVVDPEGRVLARGAEMEEDLVVVDIDLSRCAESPARQLFLRDRRPELYRDWVEPT